MKLNVKLLKVPYYSKVNMRYLYVKRSNNKDKEYLSVDLECIV